MTTRLHRFDFGSLRDFRSPLVATFLPDEVVEELPPPPPPPIFSEEELDAARVTARQLGHAEGFEAGLARAAEQADAEQRVVQTTLLQMSSILHSLQQQYHALLHTESAALSQLVLAISRKIVGDALEADSASAILALVDQCLPVILSKPKLSVDLNPAAFEKTLNQIESSLQANGYEGEIQFRANPALGIHDAVLDWGTGSASRSTATLWQEIEALLTAMPVTLAPLPVNIHHDIQNGSELIEPQTPPTL